MKLKLTIYFLLIWFSGFSTNYYFSTSTGDDSRTSAQAQSPSTPWQTITKLNSFVASLNPGDSVLFKRGETFTGQINISSAGSSGSPIILGAYGSGAKPIINGFTTLSSWASLGGSIYESATTLSTISEENMVLVNNAVKAMGRYPNTGYLTYQTHTGTTAITSNAISAAPNFVGAELVVRLNHYWTDRCVITGQTSTTITFTAQSAGNPTDGFGFFFQNSASTLDQTGEWFFNPATHKLRIYLDTSNVKASGIDTLVKIVSSFVTIDNLNIQGGNVFNVYVATSSNVIVQNSDVNYNGRENIFSTNSSTLRVNNCSLNYSNSIAIHGPGSNPSIITNNTIRNTGIFPGMGWKKSSDGVLFGITSVSDNTNISNNTVINTGYVPILFKGSNVLIKNNYVDTFCFNKDDGGGIYTYNGNADVHSGTIVQGNLVFNGIGAPAGTSSTGSAAHGIYLDDLSDHIQVIDNTVSGCSRGIFLHESNNILVRGNTSYNNESAFYTQGGTTPVTTSDIKSNIFFAKTNTQLCSALISTSDNITSIGVFDSNYYCRPIFEPDGINSTSSTTGGVIRTSVPGTKFFSLDVWKTLYGKDANSHKTALTIQDPASVDFKYNETASPKVIPLTGTWIDITGASFSNNLTLAPYTSKILINGYPDTFAYSHPIIQVQNKHYITSWNQIGSFDTVIIKASTPMTGTFFSNIGGTASRHWVVINEGGPVVTKGGMDCYDIHYIDFYGYGSADNYGFIFNAQTAGFAFPLKGKSHHIRFYGIIVNGGTQEGFTAKIEASDFVDYKCDTTVGRFIQTGLYYENCKVRYNGGEAWYMNSTGWDSRDISSCAIGPNNAFEGNDNSTTITNSGTFTNKVYLAPDLHNPNKQVTVIAKIARVSGTISGSVTVSGSNDGSSYTSLQTQTLTNVANNTYNFTFNPSLYRYYKVDVTTSGTMSANLNSYVNFYFKPPRSDSITITKCVSIAPGRSTTNFSNLSHGVYTFNKHWHVGRELNTQQGRALACGGAVISPIITDNKCFGSFNNNFWVVSEGDIIFDRNWGDSSGYYATSPNPEQNAAVQFGITGSRNGSVTWKIRNNHFYHGSGGGGSIQYVLYPGSKNTDTGNVICNNYGTNDVLCGNCLSIQPNNILVYSNNCDVTANIPPVAKAGPNGTITLPTSVYQLQGDASDFDGYVASTVWSKVSGPTYSIDNPNILFPNLSNLLAGVYFFQLKVTDNAGAITYDTMRLTVNAAPVNNPPVANAGTDITIQLPTNAAQLNGSATDDVSVASTVWFQTAGTAATISNTTILNPNITGLTTAGTRTFRLIVTDGGGLKDTDFVNVIVLPAPNVPPVVNAGNDTTVNLPSTTVDLHGIATDADGTIASTLWSNTDGCSITLASSLSTTATCTTPGPHVFTLVGTDNVGATTQDSKTATFIEPANVPPTITHIADMTVYLPRDSVIMTIVASDVDGTIENYFTYIIKTGFSANVTRSNKINPAIKQLSNGDTITVVRRVTDNDSAYGFDTTTIIVLDTTNTAPFARINRDTNSTVNPPVGQIGIDGSSSYDNDANDYIASYLWQQTTGLTATLTGATTSILHIDGMATGVYGFRLTVTDSHGATDSIDFTITVTAVLRFKIQRSKSRGGESFFPPPPVFTPFKQGFNTNSADSSQRIKNNSANWATIKTVNDAYGTQFIRYPGGTSSLTYFPDTLGRIAGRILFNFFTIIGDTEHINQYDDQNTRYKDYDYEQFLTMANSMLFTPIIVLNNQFYRDGDSIYLLENLVDKVGNVYSGGGSLHADRWTVATDSLINQVNLSHALYPGVIYWELGNECYARMSAVDYVETVNNFVNIIKPLYPNDKFIAVISKGDYQHNPVENDQWNKDVINGLKVNGMLYNIDHFAPHFYWGFADYKPTEQQLVDRMNARFFENVYAYLVNDAGFPFDYNPRFFYTEYGVSGLATGSNINPGTNTQYHALLQLDMLMKFHSKDEIAGCTSHTWINANNGSFYDSTEAQRLGYIPTTRHDNAYFAYIPPQAIADSLFIATTGDVPNELLSTLVLSQYRVCISTTGGTTYTQILNFTDTIQNYTLTGSVNWTAVSLPTLTSHDWNVTSNLSTGSSTGTLSLPPRSFVFFNNGAP